MQAPFRILVLEDEELLRISMATVLEEEGYQVVAVGRSLEAVEQAQGADFDLIVTDIRMAGMDGLDALAQVKESHPEICSMVVTGYSTEADSVRAIQLGVQEYLRKPFRLEQFLESVRRLSGRRRQEQVLLSRERALTRTAIWALETVASQGVGLGRLALRTACELGLSEEEGEECQLVTLAGLLRRQANLTDLAGLLQSLPARSRNLLDLASERWEGGRTAEGLKADEIPLAARIAAPLMLFPEVPVRELNEKAPNAFDPPVLQALERMTLPSSHSPTHSAEAAAASRRRSLLSLGSMLEEAGETSGASRAYQAVTQGSAPNREAADALVGLARLAHRLGDQNRLQEFSRRALATARQVSPASFVAAGLQLALRVSSSEGLEILEEVRRFSGVLGLPAAEARAKLAQCSLRRNFDAVEAGEALTLLARPEHHQDLIEAGGAWLLELLAYRQQSDRSHEKLLVRVAREQPREADRLLSRPLSPEIRRILAMAMASEPELLPLLQRFESDPDIRPLLAQALASPGAPELPALKLLTLGPMEIYRGRERVPDKAWKTQKNRFFLACIAAHGRPVSEDLLIEEFWPNDPSTAKANLYSTLSNLRKALKPGYWEGGDLEYVVRTKGGYQMNPDLPRWHDFEEFTRAIQEASGQDSTGQQEAAMDRLRVATQLFRGPYLEGCYMEWAMGYRARVERSMLEALRTLSSFCMEKGRHLEALEHSHRLLELDSCCQEAYHTAMLANLGLGRAEEAVRLYEVCCKTLKRELAMEPSLAILESHQRALLSL